MRPTEMTVTDLIEDYTKKDKLHVLEVATFFGAMPSLGTPAVTRLCSAPL